MKKKEINGQLCLDMFFSPDKIIAQKNSLIAGKQNLSVKAAKLLRVAIAQIEPDDETIKPYVMKKQEIIEHLGIQEDNIYRDIDKLTNELMHSFVEIREENTKRKRFKKISWVSYCEYDTKYGLMIKLDDGLKPFLINLITTYNYTQYFLDDVIRIKSFYGLRLFELLKEQIYLHSYDGMLPQEGIDITLSVQYMRECMGIEGTSFEKWSNFKNRVLDKAIEDINTSTNYHISGVPKKNGGRAYNEVAFHVNKVYNE